MPDYGRTHKALRKALLARYIPGITPCWRCKQPITTLNTSRIHLGHDDDNPTLYRGLECMHCNTSAGATRGNLARTPPTTPRARRQSRRRSRIW
jgi:hypothetical protein